MAKRYASNYTERIVRELEITDDELNELITKHGPVENMYPNFILSVLTLMRIKRLDQRLKRLEAKPKSDITLDNPIGKLTVTPLQMEIIETLTGKTDGPALEHFVYTCIEYFADPQHVANALLKREE